ncbi:BrnT family toxin [Jiella sp. M17.18]|uniref:BrnT family toxin n=1 Tax=Jiella sp. M17.18 TaxID=3234247 RepID=UPI0034DEABBF
MAATFDEIEWDVGNREKCRKHGVSISEIEHALRTNPRIVDDPTHSVHEPRFRAIGQNDAGRSIFVVFTVRRRGDQFLARPISARYMHAKEVRTYEQDEA